MLAPIELVLGGSVGSDRERERRPGGGRLNADERPPGHPARSREPGAAADRLDEADRVALNVGLLPQHLEGDTRDRDVPDPEVESGRADETGALVAVSDDLPVVHLDPGGEVIGLAEAIFGP